MMKALQIGRLLRASVSGFVVGCRVMESDFPSLGGLVRVSLAKDYHIYGLIHDIHIDDDGLVRQLVTLDNVDPQVIADNRLNRNVPLEFSVLSVGYRQNERIFHLLPPRPPLSLDTIYLCSMDELLQFTSSGRFGYFRHILRAVDIPIGEVLAAHIQQASSAHIQGGDSQWAERAIQELITLLRDDYPALMSLLGALNDALPE
ncbi:MAG: hypothetical protein JW908_13690 [Anaerolineales bacterium]|nr:hypothetical protein [Anaerolineales bacterium]